jgi:hypothetical protein
MTGEFLDAKAHHAALFSLGELAETARHDATSANGGGAGYEFDKADRSQARAKDQFL